MNGVGIGKNCFRFRSVWCKIEPELRDMVLAVGGLPSMRLRGIPRYVSKWNEFDKDLLPGGRANR